MEIFDSQVHRTSVFKNESFVLFFYQISLVITTLSWPESKVTKLGKFGAGRKPKMIKIMEQLFNEMQQLADQALYTFSNSETLKFMIESAEEKCSLYYL